MRPTALRSTLCRPASSPPSATSSGARTRPPGERSRQRPVQCAAPAAPPRWQGPPCCSVPRQGASSPGRCFRRPAGAISVGGSRPLSNQRRAGVPVDPSELGGGTCHRLPPLLQHTPDVASELGEHLLRRALRCPAWNGG